MGFVRSRKLCHLGWQCLFLAWHIGNVPEDGSLFRSRYILSKAFGTGASFGIPGLTGKYPVSGDNAVYFAWPYREVFPIHVFLNKEALIPLNDLLHEHSSSGKIKRALSETEPFLALSVLCRLLVFHHFTDFQGLVVGDHLEEVDAVFQFRNT